jgi:hypothetical protein
MEVSVWGSQLNNDGYLSKLQEAEALDASDNPDIGLLLNRLWLSRAELPLRAAEYERGAGTQVSILEVQVGCDEVRPKTSYWCEGDSTGRYCPIEEGGNPTASGTSVHIGTVACKTWEMLARKCFTLDGFAIIWCCEDTGGPLVESGVMDFWGRDLDEALRFLPATSTVCVRWVK